MKISVLYEDDDTLIINKPVGLVVNRANSVKEMTVQDWIETNFQFSIFNKDKLFSDRSGVCHRLDKETSGCLMIAKSAPALKYYLDLFKKRKVKKEYVALVHGRVEPVEGSVVLPMKRSVNDREKWQVHYEGKRAETWWKVTGRYRCEYGQQWGNKLSLLQINIKTGRTHQIRVHFSFLGWPIFADDKYLNKEIAKEDKKRLDHHFLHAQSILFNSFRGQQVQVSAPMPSDSLELLKSLVVD